MQPPLRIVAQRLAKTRLSPDLATVIGLCIGMGAVPALLYRLYWVALVCILLNRIIDGLDGILARMGNPTDAGGFLDIALDFIFYASVVWGFALADPAQNALPSATLLLSFFGTGGSFLAFAAMAAKRNIKSIDFPQKSLYYLGGITEGTETILFFVVICLLPSHFPILAYGFAALCWTTAVTRIAGGYRTLKKSASRHAYAAGKKAES